MKKLLLFGAGVAIGASASYFVTKKVVTEKVNEQVSKEYRELLNKKEKELVTKEDVIVYENQEVHEDEDPEDETEEESDDDEDQQDYTKFAKKGRVVDKPEIEDYARIMNELYPADLVEEVDRVIAERELGEEHNMTPKYERAPYVIDVEDFDQSVTFDKVSYTWWAASQTLTDEDEEILPDIEGTVGMHNLDRFGESDPLEPNTLYVRNERLGLDVNLTYDDRNFFTDL